MMNNTHNTFETSKILEVIQKEHIRPRPRWYWIMRRILLWVPGVITTFLGAYAIAGILFALTHIDWETHVYTQLSASSFLFTMLPLLWIVSFGVFSLLSIYLLRQTSDGYKHKTRNLLMGSALGSVVIGILFYNAAEAFNLQSLSAYHYPTQKAQERIWYDPTQGRIAGQIKSIDEKQHTVILLDITGKHWIVDTAQLATPITKEVIATPIRIVGIAPKKNTLIACYLLPWDFPLAATPEPEDQELTEQNLLPLFDTEIPTCDDAFGYLKGKNKTQ